MQRNTYVIRFAIFQIDLISFHSAATLTFKNVFTFQIQFHSYKEVKPIMKWHFHTSLSFQYCLILKKKRTKLLFTNLYYVNKTDRLSRGHRELLDRRLYRPDSEQRPLVRNFTTVAIVKLCCHNFTQIANFMIFFVSTISYRPTDLSLLKEFSKNVSF